jgi:hypothetical protein
MEFGVLCLWGSLAHADSIFSSAPSGAPKPGPLMILSTGISDLMRTDSCAKAMHDKLVSLGRQKKSDMIVIQELNVLEAGRKYEVKLEGREPFVAQTKTKGRGCSVAQIPSAKAIF